MINWLRKQAAAWYIENASAPKGKESLEFAGVDKEGRKYYTYPHLSQLPMCRRQKLEGIAIFSDARISPDNLKDLAHSINVVNIAAANEKDVKKKTAMHAKISHLCMEISERDKYSVPEVIHLETAAAITVREDEPHNEYSDVIQKQKVETFSQELRAGNAFFFKTNLIGALLNLSLGIDENLTQLLTLWKVEEENQNRRKEAITSYSGSEDSTTPKTNG